MLNSNITWTREQIKTRAKGALIGSYWKAFLISLVMGLTASGSTGTTANSGVDAYRDGRMNLSSLNPGNIELEGLIPYFFPIAAAATVVGLLFIFIRVFLGYSVEIGGRRYFIKAAQEDIAIENVLFAFKEKQYRDIIKTMLYKDILVFLWSLLFVIPGIIKSYSYQMVPYILAENPEIGHKRAIQISNSMTRGEKFKMWVLDISFFGWYFIGALLLGIGVLFVNPYKDATEAELYLILKEKAINNGSCSPEELTTGKILYE